MTRPSVNTRCVADSYADKRHERIIEFDGGLISFRELDDGTMRVSLYRLDRRVRVDVDHEFLVAAGPPIS